VEETSKDLVDTQGKKWNCSESREAYEHSKMKPFITVVKFMMQDSLTKIAHRSLVKFVKSIEFRCPDKVDLISSTKVENMFKRFAGIDKDLIE